MIRVYEAFVTIPKDVDRDVFVQNCLNNNEISIGTEDGIFRRAKDATSLINDADGLISTLDFPATYKERGSKVIVLDIPLYNIPIAFLRGNIQNYFRADEEKQMKLFKKYGNNSALVDLRGLKGIINMTAMGDEENKGFINVEAINTGENDSQIKYKADLIDFYTKVGTITLTEMFKFIVRDDNVKEKFATFFYRLEQGLSFIDEWDNEISQNEESLNLKHVQKINLGNGNEPILLGNTTKQWLNDFLDDLDSTYSQLTVPTAMGVSGTPLNAVAFSAIIAEYKTRLDDLLSQYSNTD